MIWKPNPKQETALKLRKVKELFYGGARGGGKTAFLLADFLAGANEWGEHWNGIFFRQSYSQLEDVVRQAKILYLPPHFTLSFLTAAHLFEYFPGMAFRRCGKAGNIST
jgi:hypothetical protein